MLYAKSTATQSQYYYIIVCMYCIYNAYGLFKGKNVELFIYDYRITG